VWFVTDEFEAGAAATDQEEVKPTVKVIMSPEAAAAAAAAAQEAEAADDEDEVTVEVSNDEVFLLKTCLTHLHDYLTNNLVLVIIFLINEHLV